MMLLHDACLGHRMRDADRFLRGRAIRNLHQGRNRNQRKPSSPESGNGISATKNWDSSGRGISMGHNAVSVTL